MPGSLYMPRYAIGHAVTRTLRDAS